MTTTRSTDSAKRPARRAAIVAAVFGALMLGYMAGIVLAHDPRLDEADLTLQKAQGLIEAAKQWPVQASRRTP
jgi:hypothetical protein